MTERARNIADRRPALIDEAFESNLAKSSLPGVRGAAKGIGIPPVAAQMDLGFYESLDGFLHKPPPRVNAFKCKGNLPNMKQLREERRRLKLNPAVSSAGAASNNSNAGGNASAQKGSFDFGLLAEALDYMKQVKPSKARTINSMALRDGMGPPLHPKGTGGKRRKGKGRGRGGSKGRSARKNGTRSNGKKSANRSKPRSAPARAYGARNVSGPRRRAGSGSSGGGGLAAVRALSASTGRGNDMAFGSLGEKSDRSSGGMSNSQLESLISNFQNATELQRLRQELAEANQSKVQSLKFIQAAQDAWLS